MAASVRRLASTLRSLAPPVLHSMTLAVAGLALERRVVPRDLVCSSNDVVGSYLQTVGTVYAVLLAFVVFVVWTQFNETRKYLEEEANELMDLARTAKGFEAPLAAAVHRGAQRYVEAVLGPEWRAMETEADEGFTDAAEALEGLWSVLRCVDLEREREKAIYCEVLGRFNDLSDARAQRLSSSRLRIPLALHVLLKVGAVITVASMYLFTVERFFVHALITAALAGVLSHVLYVIGDLDNCFAGEWRVPRKPFEDVRAYLVRSLTTPPPACPAGPDSGELDSGEP